MVGVNECFRILAVELYGGVWYIVYMDGDGRENLEEGLLYMKASSIFYSLRIEV